MICDLCGESGAQVRHASRSYDKGATLFVIENVPIVSCPRCGESYLSAETLHKIEHIKASARVGARASRRGGCVCVASGDLWLDSVAATARCHGGLPRRAPQSHVRAESGAARTVCGEGASAR